MPGLLDVGSGAADQMPWPPSSYISAPGPTTNTSTLGTLQLRLTPQYVPTTVRLTGLVVESTVACPDAGSLGRLGVWSTNSSGFGATLITPSTGTTVALDSVAGFLEATVNVVLTPGIYWFGYQGEGITTQPTMRIMNQAVTSTSNTTVQSGNAGYLLTAQPGGSFANLPGTQILATTNTPRFVYRTGVL